MTKLENRAENSMRKSSHTILKRHLSDLHTSCQMRIERALKDLFLWSGMYGAKKGERKLLGTKSVSLLELGRANHEALVCFGQC